MVEHCQGLRTDGRDLWANRKTMLWRFHNALPADAVTPSGADRLFILREGRVTGLLDTHDVAAGRMDGMEAPGPIFVATAFNCLATVSATGGFRPLWRPLFVSAIVGEDRCHLNSFAMVGEAPAYVTAVAESDVLDGWRDKRADGGVVVEVPSGRVVARGLSMPRSPRVRNGRRWLLNSGQGELGWLDPAAGRLHPVAFCLGYARGLAHVGRHAVVGQSQPHGNLTFEGLPLQDALARRSSEPRCGLVVVDLETGQTIHWLRFEHTIQKFYDMVAKPGAPQAEALGLRGDDFERATMPEAVG